MGIDVFRRKGVRLVIPVIGVALAAMMTSEWSLMPRSNTAGAIAMSEVAKLLASDGEEMDSFGSSVAIAGDTAVVSAPVEDEGGASAGAAYVYQRNEGGANSWGEVKKLTASDAQSGAFFGRAVGISGDTVVVGASEDGAGSHVGAAYVFQRDLGGTDNWGEATKLTASDAEPDDTFGRSVAINGDVIVVGSVDHTSGFHSGAVYIFERDQGGANNWGEVKKLKAADPQAFDYFGGSVSTTGDTIISGAVVKNSRTGAAYVFDRNEGGPDNWGQVKKLTASDAEPNDYFGASVAISGDRAIVGASESENGGTGTAYVFDRNQGGANNWGEVKKLLASDAEPLDFFGASVAMSGDAVLIGAYGDDDDELGIRVGTAYTFRRNQGGPNNWGEVQKLMASDAQADEFFGDSVAISGGSAVIGAYLNASGNYAGSAYVFDVGVGDTDGDGCPTKREMQTAPGTETSGGLRDYLNPHDYINPSHDGLNRVDDIVAVLNQYFDDDNDANPGLPPYAPGYNPDTDRTLVGPNAWNLGPPNGLQRVDDIVNILNHYFHDCA